MPSPPTVMPPHLPFLWTQLPYNAAATPGPFHIACARPRARSRCYIRHRTSRRCLPMLPWYQELENEFGFHTAETWNLGFALHDEGSVCGGYGGYCPDAQDSSMRERDAAALIVRSGHNALTAYEIHDHSRDCPPLQFCVQPLSYIYFKTRAYWPILWRYTGNEVEDRLCVRTSYPGYVWIQGISAEGWRSS
jgi:hypothetical protein